MIKQILIIISTATFLYAANNAVEVHHKFYTALFDTVHYYPVLVHWWLAKCHQNCSKGIKRLNKFAPDPLIPNYTNIDSDYQKSGYDRGHNMPAYDNECDSIGMIESFYFTNISPQTKRLNRKQWKELENYSRNLVQEYDSIKIWCGAVDSIGKIGKVTIPGKFWKVIWIKSADIKEAFIFENNNNINGSFHLYKVPVDSISKITGFNF